MQSTDPGEVTILLQQVSEGDSHAADRLIPLVLDELRQLARLQLRQRSPITPCSRPPWSTKRLSGWSEIRHGIGKAARTSSV